MTAGASDAIVGAMAKNVREKLDRAIADRRLVRITRDLVYSDNDTCVVLAIGAKWVLVRSVYDGGYLDGFHLLRIKDITVIEKDRSFAAKAVRLQTDWPALAPEQSIDLDSVAALLASVGADGRLFGIEKELERRALWIGTLDEIDEKWLWLNEVTPRGRWKKKPLGYRLRAITRVSFGGRYMDALLLAAGDSRRAKAVA